jgi:hypothetical protein
MDEKYELRYVPPNPDAPPKTKVPPHPPEKPTQITK